MTQEEIDEMRAENARLIAAIDPFDEGYLKLFGMLLEADVEFEVADIPDEAEGTALDYQTSVQNVIDGVQAALMELKQLRVGNAQQSYIIKSLKENTRRHDLYCEALAEIKATVDGDSDQPVKDIVYGLLAEIEETRK